MTRVFVKKKKLKPGFYWVSDAGKPTKQDWYIAHYTGGDSWYVPSNECSYCTSAFRHIDPTPLKWEPADRRALPSGEVKSFLEFVLTSILGYPFNLSADKFKSLHAEWQGSGK